MKFSPDMRYMINRCTGYVEPWQPHLKDDPEYIDYIPEEFRSTEVIKKVEKENSTISDSDLRKLVRERFGVDIDKSGAVVEEEPTVEADVPELVPDAEPEMIEQEPVPDTETDVSEPAFELPPQTKINAMKKDDVIAVLAKAGIAMNPSLSRWDMIKELKKLYDEKK